MHPIGSLLAGAGLPDDQFVLVLALVLEIL